MGSARAEVDLISQQLESLTNTLLTAPVPSHENSLALVKADENLAKQHVKIVEKMLQKQLKPPRSLTRPKAIHVAKQVLKKGGIQLLEIGAGVVLITAGTLSSGPGLIVPLTMGILMIVDGVSHIAHITFEELMEEAHDAITDPHIIKALTHEKGHHKPPKSLHPLEGTGYFIK